MKWIKIKDDQPLENSMAYIYTKSKKMYRAITHRAVTKAITNGNSFWLVGMAEYYIGVNDITHWAEDIYPEPPEDQ